MVQRKSVRHERLLREFGANIARWRKINGFTAAELADRAFVTRETLRNVEAGTGAPRLDSIVAILAALGIADTVVAAADPYSSPAARARIDDYLNAGGSW
ncbi:MAG: helix-turn-helix transcriptional regulator [Rhodoglobus sp.]|nr:helix-turn-helix transcriptional regulator [Rhodoglobus sp.]